MNIRSNQSNTLPGTGLSHRIQAVRVPVCITLILFVGAAAIGGEIFDRELLPLVRFISLLMLALALYTSIVVGQYCAYSQKRWLAGHLAAGCFGLGGGFLWSAAAFGAGFFFFMAGILLCTLLMLGELQRDATRRRQAKHKAQ